MAPFLAEDQIALPVITHPTQDPTRAQCLEQLERIVASSHFRNSKRYPSFLRFVVERTVEENSEVLKERNLGIEIFGRPSDYDTNADPIVRVTAGEVRKRIAQYYQTAGHEQELRIDLPLGSYVPHFYPPSHAAPVVETKVQTKIEDHTGLANVHAPAKPDGEPLEPAVAPATQSRPTGKWFSYAIYIACMVVFTLAAVGGMNWWKGRSPSPGVKYFWQSTLSAPASAIIVIGIHSIDSRGKTVANDPYVQPARNEPQNSLSAMENYDMVPVSDIVSFSRITDLLTQRSHTYRTIASSDTTLEELRQAPVILIGGLNNVWTMRLTSSLRYRFVSKSDWVNGIEDSQKPSTFWVWDNAQPAHGNSHDYAIVASYLDPTIEQHVVVAAGIGKNGTLAATEFVTSEKYMSSWLAEAKVPPNKNVELVLRTDVLDGEPGPPHVIASATW